MNFIFRLGDAPGDKQLGGKAAALAAMQGCGVLIPEWFVLLPNAFESSLSEADRQTLFEQENQMKTKKNINRREQWLCFVPFDYHVSTTT